MKLFNPTDCDILDYHIEIPRFVDFEGNMVDIPRRDIASNFFHDKHWRLHVIPQKNSLKVTIKAGETIELPKYAGEYLKGIYRFLRDVTAEQ